MINVSSIIGSRGYTGLTAYAASKAGMDGATRALAPAACGARSAAAGRWGTVADVVPLARFLLSEEARFITGQTLIVDGGITC